MEFVFMVAFFVLFLSQVPAPQLKPVAATAKVRAD